MPSTNNFFLVLLGPISFGIQQAVQIFDFWITLSLLRVYSRKYGATKCYCPGTLAASYPKFTDYKRSCMGAITFVIGSLVAAGFPQARVIEATGSAVPDASWIFDVLLTGVIFASGTEGANTVSKFLSTAKSRIALPLVKSTSDAESEPPSTAEGGPVFGNGTLISNIEVRVLFVGNAWLLPALTSVMSSFEKFVETYVGLIAPEQLSSFSDSTGKSIGKGNFGGAHVVPIEAQTLNDTDQQNDVQDLIRSFVGQEQIPVNRNSHFCLVLSGDIEVLWKEPGVSAKAYGSFSCDAFQGYHQSIDKFYTYSVICGQCSADPAITSDEMFPILTRRTSHELAETITNPFGDGWTVPPDQEVCDPCNDQTKLMRGYVVTKVCDSQGNCV